MRAVLQRVSSASVSVDDVVVGEIGMGLLALVGVTHGDTEAGAERLADKIAGLRILPGELGVADVAGAGVLVVSQFTLYGDATKGRRPTWAAAAPGPIAEPLVEAVARRLATRGVEVARGRFGAQMRVCLVNEGPFTVLLEV